MKWYKMDCDAQDNLDMVKLVDEWGWEWYGRYYAILGKIGMLVTERRQTFALQTNNGCPFPVKLLSNDLGTNVERLTNFLNYLSDNNLIDKKAWREKGLIFCPKLRERADEYTKKLLTKSRQSPDQEEEEEVDIEEDKNKKDIVTRQKATTERELLESNFKLRLDADEFQLFKRRVLGLISDWNTQRGQSGKPAFVWTQTVGSFDADLTKLIYGRPFTDESKKKLLYDVFNLTQGRLNWPTYVEMGIEAMLKATEKTAVRQPYRWLVAMLQKPSELHNAAEAGTIAGTLNQLKR